MSFNKYYFLIVFTLILFNSEINWSQTNVPPIVTAFGDEPYCPGTPINVATSVTIVDIDNTGTEIMYVQISQGYENSYDTLTLTGSHPNITTSWNPVSAKLELYSISGAEVPYSEFIAALESVVFNTTNVLTTNDRYFSITWGSANYLPSTGHFYEYYSDVGITWTAAKAAAESLSYFGLQGYLVTILSAEEAQMSGEQAEGTGWIGGSDAATEGVWKWVTGPENGTVFWNGDSTGSAPSGAFSFWNNQEPNNLGNEDYAHIKSDNIAGPSGSWNDLINTGAPSGDYQPKGYIVEYGGMGEPPLNISASTSIHIPKITNTLPNSRCGDGVVSLEASADYGTINWYDTATGGNLIGTGPTFTTPIISSNTSYFVSTALPGCVNALRTIVIASVRPIPTIDTATGDTICFNGTGNLSATASLGNINWYDVPTGGAVLATGTTFTSPVVNTTTTYYIDASTSFCTSPTRTPVVLIVYAPPAPTGDAIQYFCEKDNSIITDLITDTGINITWYDAPTDGTAYTGTEALIDGQNYYASQNDGTCESFNRLNVLVTIYNSVTPLLPSEIPVMSQCDDAIDGDDTNGLSTFDLTSNANILVNGEPLADFDLSYFTDSNFTSGIAIPSSFENTIIGGQTIYVRMTNKLDSSCYTDTSFGIEVFELPLINAAVELKNCDEDGNPDGFTDFNLNEANEFITLGDNTLLITYHLTSADANTGVNVIPPFPFNNATASTVYARVQNSNTCHRVATVTLNVSTTFFPPSFLYELSACDDDNTIDGLHLFDLTQATSDIISQFPSGQNLRVQYYTNLSNAQLEQNEILPQNSFVNETPFSQTLWVRVESDDNGDCFGIGPHLVLIVHPRPEFEVIPEAVICLNLPPITLEAFNPIDVYTYEWTDQSNTVISTEATVEVATGGIYTVVATSGLNCQSFPQTVTVSESNIATITKDDVSITDDSTNNSVSIDNSNSNLGIGDYEYSLDAEFGPYQDESTFEMVAPGIHTIYVRDKNSCGVASLEISVIGFPKFFTPNNDGYNDHWQILGVSQNFYPSSLIYIFDRFGKILAKVDPTSDGWDGFYNGKMLPSDDYWFGAVLVDNVGNTRERRGHFSMIRR